MTHEQMTEELIALRDYFQTRGISPTDAVIMMTRLIGGVVGSLSMTREQRSEGVDALSACIEMLETTH